MVALPIYSGKSSEGKTDFPIITKHAWKRFITRHRHLPRCPMRKLRYLIANAVREDLGSGAVESHYPPYPVGPERTAINKEFDGLFAAIRKDKTLRKAIVELMA